MPKILKTLWKYLSLSSFLPVLLSPIKLLPFLGKTYFQGFYLVYGFSYGLLKHRIDKRLRFGYLLVVYSMLLGLFYFFKNSQSISLLRSLQLLSLFFFTQFLVDSFNQKKWKLTSVLIGFFSLTYYCIEIIFTAPLGGRSFLIIERYLHLVGEPNYSAFFFTCFFAISLLNRQELMMVFWFILTLLTFSRTPLLFYTCFVLLYSLVYFFRNNVGTLLKIVLVLIFLQPLSMYLLYKYSSPGFLNKLETVTTRFYIQPIYFKVFVDNPLGVGLSKGYENFPRYLNEERDYLVSKVGLKRVDKNEQHSTYVQILTELGIVGYLLFCLFLYQVTMAALKNSRLKAITFVSILPMMFALNTLNEVGFYYVLSVVLRRDGTDLN